MDEHPSPPQTENEKTHDLMRSRRMSKRIEDMRKALQDGVTLHDFYHGKR